MEVDKVLFVDDEPNVLASIKRGLFEEEFEQFYATSAHEALTIMEKERDIAVVVTDLRMPGMTGIDLLKVLIKLYPYTARVVLTAYSQVSTIISSINTGQVFKYIIKPWNMNDDFIPVIRQAIDFHKMIVRNKEYDILASDIHDRNMLIEDYIKNEVKIRTYLKDNVLTKLKIHHEKIEKLSEIDNIAVKSIYEDLKKSSEILKKEILKIKSLIKQDEFL